jgi:hypothetical protein
VTYLTEVIGTIPGVLRAIGGSFFGSDSILVKAATPCSAGLKGDPNRWRILCVVTIIPSCRRGLQLSTSRLAGPRSLPWHGRDHRHRHVPCVAEFRGEFTAVTGDAWRTFPRMGVASGLISGCGGSVAAAIATGGSSSSDLRKMSCSRSHAAPRGYRKSSIISAWLGRSSGQSLARRLPFPVSKDRLLQAVHTRPSDARQHRSSESTIGHGNEAIAWNDRLRS